MAGHLILAWGAFNLKSVIIYTDGACSGNPGPGGWGAYLQFNGKEKKICGFVKDTTNNRMELQAVIESLRLLNQECKVDLYSDSIYVINGMTKWVVGWQQRSWRSSSNKPVKNLDLWQELLKLAGPHLISWHWVKGHNGNAGNEIADALARSAIEENI